MRVVIETNEAGVCWKLQTIPDGETLTSSIVYYRSMDECLADLERHARSWRKYLPGRTVETVGEVKVITNGEDDKTLADLWPELEKP